MGIIRGIQRFGVRRLSALALGTGVFTMGLDAGIEHFADGTSPGGWRMLPVGFGFVAMAVLVFFTFRRWPRRTFRLGVRSVALLSALVGAIGLAFHAATFLQLFDGVTDLDTALAMAPPLLAPGAFVALGGLLWLLVSPRVDVGVHPRNRDGKALHAVA